MPFTSSTIIIAGTTKDRRRKLTDSQKKAIAFYRDSEGLSYQKLADQYGVSKRTIVFICNPDSLEENKKRRAERGGTKIYYNKEKHAANTREHRRYKQELLLKGEITLNNLSHEKPDSQGNIS